MFLASLAYRNLSNPHAPAARQLQQGLEPLLVGPEVLLHPGVAEEGARVEDDPADPQLPGGDDRPAGHLLLQLPVRQVRVQELIEGGVGLVGGELMLLQLPGQPVRLSLPVLPPELVSGAEDGVVELEVDAVKARSGYLPNALAVAGHPAAGALSVNIGGGRKIGRASCRERV